MNTDLAGLINQIGTNLKDRQDRHEKHIDEQLKLDREQLKNSHSIFMAEHESQDRMETEHRNRMEKSLSNILEDLKDISRDICELSNKLLNIEELQKKDQEKFEKHVEKHVEIKEKSEKEKKAQTWKIHGGLVGIIGTLAWELLRTVGIIP
jgi:ATP-dependent Lon protease